MLRIRNWDVELAIWAAQQIGKPFVWGETDCGALVRVAHRVMYNEDLWPQLPPYRSRFGALRVLARGSVRERLLASGATEYRLPFAQSGDVVIYEGDTSATGCCLVVVADKALVTEEGAVISTVPLFGVPQPATVYRIPDHG
jgi:hypothetical protein